MRVLHVITGLGVGGAEQQLLLLLRHLPAECEVVTLTNPGRVAEALCADGVPVTHLGMDGNRDLAALPRLAGLIRAGRYDVVHTHLYRACVYGRLAARMAGVRAVVATEHSLGDTQIEGRRLTWANRALYRAAERLGYGTFAVSETVARRLERWGVRPDRVHLAPNGIDPESFAFSGAVRCGVRARLGIPQDAYLVGGVGRQTAGKDYDLLVRAVAAHQDTHLLLVGDGPERVPLLRTAHRLGASGRVHFAGAHENPGPDALDVPGLLAAMDLFVSPSPEETFGLAAVEALAAGLPVLYVACPALEDLPSEDAPGARKVAGYELPAAIRRERLAGPRRMPVPAAVDHYRITRTARAVTAVYEAAVASVARSVGATATGTATTGSATATSTGAATAGSATATGAATAGSATATALGSASASASASANGSVPAPATSSASRPRRPDPRSTSASWPPSASAPRPGPTAQGPVPDLSAPDRRPTSTSWPPSASTPRPGPTAHPGAAAQASAPDLSSPDRRPGAVPRSGPASGSPAESSAAARTAAESAEPGAGAQPVPAPGSAPGSGAAPGAAPGSAPEAGAGAGAVPTPPSPTASVSSAVSPGVSPTASPSASAEK